MQKMSQQAGLVLYDGLHQSSAAFMRGLATAKAAWLHARQATAAVVQDLGQDLADAGQVVVHETPLVLKRLQEDAHTAAKSTKAALQHAGWKLQRGVHHSLHQVGNLPAYSFSTGLPRVYTSQLQFLLSDSL